jgi:hypothetical protein
MDGVAHEFVSIVAVRSTAVVFVLLALPAAALAPPHNQICNALISPPVTTYALPDQVLELPIAGDACFAISVSTSTPTILSIEKVTMRDPQIISAVTVRTLAPGNGVLDIVSGLSFNGNRQLSVSVFVDDCSAGSHTITMPAVINTSPKKVVVLNADVHGIFNRALDWRIGGVYIGSGPSALFTTSTPGSYDVVLRGESECGIVEAHTILNVSAGKTRGARH